MRRTHTYKCGCKMYYTEASSDYYNDTVDSYELCNTHSILRQGKNIRYMENEERLKLENRILQAKKELKALEENKNTTIKVVTVKGSYAHCTNTVPSFLYS